MTDNRYEDSDGTLANPECGGKTLGQSCSAGEVRWFSTGGDSNAILCANCAKYHGYEWGKGFLDNSGSKGKRANEGIQSL